MNNDSAFSYDEDDNEKLYLHPKTNVIFEDNDNMTNYSKISFSLISYLNAFSIVIFLFSYYLQILAVNKDLNVMSIAIIIIVSIFNYLALIKNLFIDEKTDNDIKKILLLSYGARYFYSNISISTSFLIYIYFDKYKESVSGLLAIISLILYLTVYYQYKSKEKTFIINSYFNYLSISLIFSVSVSVNLLFLCDFIIQKVSIILISISLTVISILFVTYFRDTMICMLIFLYQLSIITQFNGIQIKLTILNGICLLYSIFSYSNKSLCFEKEKSSPCFENGIKYKDYESTYYEDLESDEAIREYNA